MSPTVNQLIHLWGQAKYGVDLKKKKKDNPWNEHSIKTCKIVCKTKPNPNQKTLSNPESTDNDSEKKKKQIKNIIITWGEPTGGYLHRVAQDKKGVAVRKCFMAFKAEEHSVLELREETGMFCMVPPSASFCIIISLSFLSLLHLTLPGSLL